MIFKIGHSWSQLFRVSYLAFIFVIFIYATGCTSDYQKMAVQPVAKVNDHVLDVKDFSILFARSLKDLDALAAKDPNNIKRFKEKILNDFVEASLMEDWAKANNLRVEDAAIEKMVKEIRASYPDDISFRRFLAEENLSFSDWKESLKKRLLYQLIFQRLDKDLIPPTEEEIKAYYKENQKLFKKKSRIYLAQIVVPEEPTAEEILKVVKTKDFAELAKKYSIFPEAKKGGEIGWIEKGSVDFFDPLFALPLGPVNKIIKSDFGYHIVKIVKKDPEGERSLDEVRGQVLRSLTAKKEQALFIKWLDVQLRSSKVYKNYDLINSINPTTKGSNE